MEEERAFELLREELHVPRETLARIGVFLELLQEENAVQNLVSRSTLDRVWSRHILDSAQLLRFAPASGTWLDLGTGAGFPGLIAALLFPGPVTMVESRKLRVAFLERAAQALILPATTRIVCSRIESFEARPFAVISARAFAPLGRLLTLAERFALPETRWVLPKGRNAKSELEAAGASWQGEFRLEPSLTDPDAQIIVAERVRRRVRGKSKK